MQRTFGTNFSGHPTPIQQYTCMWGDHTIEGREIGMWTLKCRILYARNRKNLTIIKYIHVSKPKKKYIQKIYYTYIIIHINELSPGCDPHKYGLRVCFGVCFRVCFALPVSFLYFFLKSCAYGDQFRVRSLVVWGLGGPLPCLIRVLHNIK